MHEMENISNRERLVWACVLSSSRIGANDSCVYARHICSCTSVTWTNYERNSGLMKLQVLVRMGDVYK